MMSTFIGKSAVEMFVSVMVSGFGSWWSGSWEYLGGGALCPVDFNIAILNRSSKRSHFVVMMLVLS